MIKIKIRVLQDTSSSVESVIDQHDQFSFGTGCRRDVDPKRIVTLIFPCDISTMIVKYILYNNRLLGECTASGFLSTKTLAQNETEPKYSNECEFAVIRVFVLYATRPILKFCLIRISKWKKFANKSVKIEIHNQDVLIVLIMTYLFYQHSSA